MPENKPELFTKTLKCSRCDKKMPEEQFKLLSSEDGRTIRAKVCNRCKNQ